MFRVFALLVSLLHLNVSRRIGFADNRRVSESQHLAEQSSEVQMSDPAKMRITTIRSKQAAETDVPQEVEFHPVEGDLESRRGDQRSWRERADRT